MQAAYSLFLYKRKRALNYATGQVPTVNRTGFLLMLTDQVTPPFRIGKEVLKTGLSSQENQTVISGR